jgi:hypothetical protein
LVLLITAAASGIGFTWAGLDFSGSGAGADLALDPWGCGDVEFYNNSVGTIRGVAHLDVYYIA